MLLLHCKNYIIKFYYISNLSFLVDVGKTFWYTNGIKKDISDISEKLKTELPDSTLFNISSLIFNIEQHKEQELTKYSCFYQKSSDSLCFLVEENAKYADFSKEIMINLMEFGQKLGINSIFLLITRKNKEYVKILQGMMTVGFEYESQIKTATIGGTVYKILKMNLKAESDDIQEVEF